MVRENVILCCSQTQTRGVIGQAGRRRGAHAPELVDLLIVGEGTDVPSLPGMRFGVLGVNWCLRG